MMLIDGQRRQHVAEGIADHAVQEQHTPPAARRRKDRRHLIHQDAARAEPPGNGPQIGRNRLPPVRRPGAGMAQAQGLLPHRRRGGHALCLSGAVRPRRSISSRTSFLVILP